MRFEIQDGRLAYVEDMTRAIAETYCGMLDNAFMFRAKLNVLTVQVKPDGGADRGGEFRVHGYGECGIVLYMGDNRERNAHVIAHELAHCLISSMRFGGMQEYCDGSISTDSPFHRTYPDGVERGFGMEETMADVLAREAVYRTRGAGHVTRSGHKKRTPLGEAGRALMALAACFGSPLHMLERLDEESDIGKKVSFPIEYYPFNGVELIRAGVTFHNLFWWHVARMSFGDIVRQYDELMGGGAFARLLDMFDTHCRGMRGMSADASDEEQGLTLLIMDGTIRGMMKDIDEFRKLFDAQKSDFSERREVNNSLRGVLERMQYCCCMIEGREEAPQLKADVSALRKELKPGSPRNSFLRAETLLSAVEQRSAASEETARDVRDMRGMLNAAREVIDYYAGRGVKKGGM